MTIDSIREAQRKSMYVPVALQTKIIFTASALADTEERLFPASRHRSKRIKKKLMKRYGGEFRRQPCMWRVGDVIYAHPAYRERLRAQLAELEKNAWMSGSAKINRHL